MVVQAFNSSVSFGSVVQPGQCRRAKSINVSENWAGIDGLEISGTTLRIIAMFDNDY